MLKNSIKMFLRYHRTESKSVMASRENKSLDNENSEGW